MEAQSASVLWRSEKSAVLSTIALRVLDHFSVSFAKNTDLEGLLNRDEAGVIAAAAHDCRGCGSGNGLTERRGASAIVVLGFIGGGIVATNSGIGVAAVGIKITSDLRCGRA